MNKNLEDKLFKEFSNLFEPYSNIRDSCMCFGFEHNDGWYNLIYSLLKELKEDDFEGRITQVKEKFAGLRVYVNWATDKQYDIIDKYEALSYKTCEYCGSTFFAKPRPTGWIKTMCIKCYLIYIINRHKEKIKRIFTNK